MFKDRQAEQGLELLRTLGPRLSLQGSVQVPTPCGAALG